MIKRFAYIVLLLILIPWLSSAHIKAARHHNVFYEPGGTPRIADAAPVDTVPAKTAKQKQQEIEDKKKIKEITKAKRLPKPEKVDEPGATNATTKVKPKRQRRPSGMERPPEIPRRNGN